jgi:hypothetical protein
MGLISNGSTIFDNGSMGSGFGGSMVFIKKLTASASATLSFVDGTDGVVLDDTYKEYVFTFKDIHPATDNTSFQFNMSTDSGSTYAVTKTSTKFRALHNEADNDAQLQYDGDVDLAQSTDDCNLLRLIGNGVDECSTGVLQLFNPSSTTYVKHFIFVGNELFSQDYSINNYIAGYGNTTSAVNAIRFQMSSGNIDAGDICLYGIA